MNFLPAVVMRAERMGGIVVPKDELLLIEHAVSSVLVQLPAVVRFKV